MQITKSLDQHIAVFGESGSGKTVLLSSFYGRAQEPTFSENSNFRIIADDIGQGNRLHQNYLGMRREDRLPHANRFKSTTFSFSVRVRSDQQENNTKAPFNALKLIWHDYPGEWFEDGVSGAEEEQRRIDTFKSLLQSDVALLLVDAKRLLENEGEEERYLKSLINNIKNSLLSLEDELLENNKPLTRFPRIWMFALSKADLLPNYTAYDFRDLMIAKVAGEIAELRSVLAKLVEGSEALSVGEDFILLSSAKFQAGKIDLDQNVGLDLILPISSTLPFQRHLRWANTLTLPGKVGKELLNGLGDIAFFLRRHQKKLPAPVAAVINRVNPTALLAVSRLAGAALEDVNKKALQRKNYLAAILSGFQIDLEKATESKTLLRNDF